MLQLTAKKKLNKRSAIPLTLPDKNNIVDALPQGTVFLGELVTGVDLPAAPLNIWYKDQQGFYYWGGGVSVSEITIPQPLPLFANLELPLTRAQCLTCARWMNTNFGEKFSKAVTGTPFSKELLFAIACQETAIYWQKWIATQPKEEILGRCVFDASGDVNHTRMAFPKDTPAFIKAYGNAIADELIAEANKTRAWHGWGPKQWVYAGYGIFQYDLQHIKTDEAFFTEKKWYSMDECLVKVMLELNTKWKKFPNDLFKTVKAYNGSGIRAEHYAQNVFQFMDWIQKGL